MANALISWINHVAKSTTILTPITPEVATLPAANLKDPEPAAVWRTMGDTASIVIDFGEEVPIDAIALVGTNLSENAAIAVVRTGPITADFSLDADVVIDSGLPPIGTFSRDGALASYYDASGNLRFAPNNWLRLDHDPETGERIGWLIEGVVKNRCLHSEDLTKAVWTKSNVTVLSGQTPSPTGGSDAQMIRETTAAGFHEIVQTGLSCSDFNSPMVASAIVKASGRSMVKLILEDGAGSSASSEFDLESRSRGIVITAGGWTYQDAYVEASGNGYVRIVLAIDTPNLSSVTLRLRLLNGPASQSYTGDGSSGVLVRGIQLEDGSGNDVSLGVGARSYVPTGSTVLDKGEDKWLASYNSPPLSRSTVSFALEYRNCRIRGAKVFFSASDGTTDNRFNISDTSCAVRSNGVAQVSITRTSVYGIERQAFRLGPDDYARCANGGAISKDQSVIFPQNLSTISIGCDRGASNFAGGHIRKIAGYPFLAPDSEIVRLSSLGSDIFSAQGEHPLEDSGPPNPDWGGSLACILPGPLATRQLLIDISDPGKSFIDIGLIWAGPAFRPKRNFSYGDQWKLQDLAEKTRGRRGQLFARSVGKARAVKVTFDLLSDQEVYDAVMEIDRVAGASGNILYVEDPDQSAARPQTWMVGMIRDSSEIGRPAFGIRSRTFEIEDRLVLP